MIRDKPWQEVDVDLPQSSCTLILLQYRAKEMQQLLDNFALLVRRYSSRAHIRKSHVTLACYRIARTAEPKRNESKRTGTELNGTELNGTERN